MGPSRSYLGRAGALWAAALVAALTQSAAATELGRPLLEDRGFALWPIELELSLRSDRALDDRPIARGRWRLGHGRAFHLEQGFVGQAGPMVLALDCAASHHARGRLELDYELAVYRLSTGARPGGVGRLGAGATPDPSARLQIVRADIVELLGDGTIRQVFAVGPERFELALSLSSTRG